MLTAKFASSPLRLADHDTTDAPAAADFAKISAPLDGTLTAELDGAQWYLGLPGEEILLAALGLAIARTIGEGVVPVDVTGHSGPVALWCTSAGLATATESLLDVHRSLAEGPSAPTLAAQPASEIFFALDGAEPALRHRLELRTYRADGLVQVDWWYDIRSFDAYTVTELAEQLPLALIELTSEASPLPHTPVAVGH
ncbi:hypothetical protein [Mycobacterium sp. 1274761.0]|uniref:hypothetical protein n=1 Tax=Mycobacterium sp. 1274761.0 TaxID=1834077 RepID=UPI0008004361|nr:hypothetical protein [Mycobacterium sp. 1274761.0]OBK70375.1 hypothetical protein A5651_22740 [Mycobacterium sp. 1274761.0]